MAPGSVHAPSPGDLARRHLAARRGGSPRPLWHGSTHLSRTRFATRRSAAAAPLTIFRQVSSPRTRVRWRWAFFVAASTPAPILATAYGVTGDRGMADALLEARTSMDVLRLEEAALRRGGIQLDEGFGQEFDEFVRRTVKVSNRRLAVGAPTSSLQALIRPLPLFWVFERGRPYRQTEPIETVHIYRVSSFFDGRAYTMFRKELLRTVEVPP